MLNAFLNSHGSGVASEIELARSTDDVKQSQLKRLADFQQRNAGEAEACLARLRQAVIDNDNVFAVMTEAMLHCSLRQICNALYEVGGQYRRSMQGVGAGCTARGPAPGNAGEAVVGARRLNGGRPGISACILSA